MINRTNKQTVGSPADTLETIDLIELLAENELSSERRHKLLLDLDSQPELWRTLALAFVERQVVSASVAKVVAAASGTMVERQAFEGTAPLEANERSKTFVEGGHREGSRSGAWWIMACVMLFGAGFWIGGSAEFPMRPAADSAPDWAAVEPEADNPKLAGTGTDQGDVGRLDGAPESQWEAEQEAVVGYVKWIGNSGLRLSPVFSGASIDQDWLAENPPVVDKTLQRSLAKVGMRATPERKFVSLRLRDGKQFTIPMDDVAVQRVVHEVF